MKLSKLQNKCHSKKMYLKTIDNKLLWDCSTHRIPIGIIFFIFVLAAEAEAEGRKC